MSVLYNSSKSGLLLWAIIYNVTLTAGDTYFPFKIPILDDKIPEEDENFILAIDPSSLPCSLTVGNLHPSYSKNTELT